MGYFSNLAIDMPLSWHDHSVLTPEQQLLWRVEDLQDRLEALKLSGAAYSSSVCYSQEDLRYMLPRCFSTFFEAEKALDLAIAELQERYGIDLHPVTCEDTGMDAVTGRQLTFYGGTPEYMQPAA